MIGDGMGPSHLSAYRYFKDDPETKRIETTIFDELFIGKISTSPDDDEQSVTDSAASATAYSAGIKTYSGSISYDTRKKPLVPLFERAVKAGLSTGVVVTSQVNHATPAAFAASVKSRRKLQKIAKQYVNREYNGKPIMEVILGGGTQYFTGDKNQYLLEALKSKGFQVSLDEASFEKLNDDAPMIGLYDEVGLQSYLDRKNTKITLPNMTKKALARLSRNKQGFVLMVEGSQIDWASHGDNILDVMWETDEFADAIKTAVDFAKNDGETLVFITADHETGGLSIGSDGVYNWQPEILHKAKRSVIAMVKQKLAGGHWKDIFAQQSITLTKQQLEAAPNSTKERELYDYVAGIYAELTQTGWTTTGHTGVDVWLMAYGVGASEFTGHWSNEVIGQKLIKLIEE